MALRAWSPPRDPTVYSTLEIDVSRALAYLERLRGESGVKVTPTHLVAKAIATALRRNPHANAVIRRGWVHLRERVDVFLQVVADGGEDLGGTKIERADEKSLVEIARELAEKAERIRAHRDPELEKTKRTMDRLPTFMLGWVLKLTEHATHTLGLDLTKLGVKPDPFGGAMVSNIGTFGIDYALAPIVPFSRCPIVLIVGTVRPRAIVVGGDVVARPVLIVGCTFDHRLLDGALASALARVVQEVISDPEKFDRSERPAAVADATARAS
jgi:pyruvate dehydrogenase E2 component (dihydrolipoamide acetyltransferase)